jgi:hypothetical protein
MDGCHKSGHRLTILSADLGVPETGLVAALTGPSWSGGGAGAREVGSIDISRDWPQARERQG